MSTRWRMRCPYCNAEFAYGYGYLKLPKFWVPFVRCQICGRLMNTNCKEYLNMPVAERLKLKNNAQTTDDIKHSLERTNQEEYRALLEKGGYKFYPITEADEQHFAGIKQLSECKPTAQTTESLYDLGILIKEEEKDETGGVKQEVLEERQKQYKQTKKIILSSIFAGLSAFILFGLIFSYISSTTDLSFLAIIPAIIAFIAVGVGMDRYYKYKSKTEAAQKETEEQQKAEEVQQGSKEGWFERADEEERQRAIERYENLKNESENRKKLKAEQVQIQRADEEERQRAIERYENLKKENEARKKFEAEQAKKIFEERARKQKIEQDTATCKELLEQCGMQFFIQYYPQLIRLPIPDITVSDHYFPERQVRLTAAKKIVDLGLEECALNYIIQTYGDVFSSEVIEQAKSILYEKKTKKEK